MNEAAQANGRLGLKEVFSALGLFFSYPTHVLPGAHPYAPRRRLFLPSLIPLHPANMCRHARYNLPGIACPA